MGIAKTALARRGVLVLGLAALYLLGGCQSAEPRAAVREPIFFPPPPERPRLQFLKSFSSAGDLGVRGPSGFETFVLGEAEQRDGIATPYGLAISDGRIYVCDVGKRRVEVLDLANRTFGYMTEDRRLVNPVNIFIDDSGTKYVADPTAGAVFVFDARNSLQAILGRELKISPIDVVVRGPHCYVTDFASNQVVVLEKTTGREVARIGEQGEAETQFKLISDLTFGPEGDLYVTDKLKAKIYQFGPSGDLKRTIGRLGDNIDELVRPKGIAVDDSGRIWVVDAGVSMGPSVWSTEVVKIYDQQGRLLLFFGRPGNEPGNTNLPAKIVLDYEHVGLFKQYAVPGADIKFLVLVTNQYGPNKVSVYGFGEFPVTREPDTAVREPVAEAVPRPVSPPAEPQTEAATRPPEAPPATPPAVPKVEPPTEDDSQLQRTREIADIYYRSMALYRGGRLEEARAGFVQVIRSGLIPPAMEETLKGYIREIDLRLKRNGTVGP